ncbi:MAG: hypothetical protein B6U89_02985 [Desulfurococcales archaeon ex4484_58]|nr:MAG: hypothetical protein B6U89_02985 [Desulfurococcales archaeon ex4484_58]
MGERRKGFRDEDIERYSEELLREYMVFREKIIGENDEVKRYSLFLGFINKWFIGKDIGYMVLTGGFAVELLCGRVYRTYDIDIITSNLSVARVLERFLNRISEKISRGYLPFYEEIASKSIDIVSTSYTRKKKPVEIKIDDLLVYVDPPEELIVNYLVAWKYWDSTIDRDKALWLLIVLSDKLDREYLYGRASEEGVLDKLEELISYTK